MACIILLVATSMATDLLLPSARENPPPDLHSLASECLTYLDQKEVLAPLVYRNSTAQLQAFILALLPTDVGYRLTVYNIHWDPLMVIGTGTNGVAASSACYYICGWNGTADPRIIVLTLSR